MRDEDWTAKYRDLKVRRISFPTPTPAGDGWWRHVWHVEHPAKAVGQLPPLPAPVVDAPEFTLQSVALVGVFECGNRCLRVELVTPYAQMVGPEAGYVSLVMQALQRDLGPLRIDGHLNHPILKITTGPARI